MTYVKLSSSTRWRRALTFAILDSVCDLCGGETVQIFSTRDYRRPLDRVEYRVKWCHECAFGRLTGKFTPVDVNKFFDIPYYTHGPGHIGGDERLADPENQREKTLVTRAIIHLAWRVDGSIHFTPGELGSPNNRTVCDIGTGNGQNLKRLSDVGFKVVGIEPDPVARAAALKVAEVFDGTAEALPKAISSQTFDVVLLLHVLDACIDFKSAISNVRSILSRTGTVVIEVPNCAAKGFQLYGPEWPWTDVPRHHNFFTEKSLRLALEACGLSVSKVYYLGYTRQFTPFWKATQTKIHKEIGNANSRRRRPAVLWLAQTVFCSRAAKYDSIRVHAVQKASNTNPHIE